MVVFRSLRGIPKTNNPSSDFGAQGTQHEANKSSEDLKSHRVNFSLYRTINEGNKRSKVVARPHLSQFKAE